MLMVCSLCTQVWRRWAGPGSRALLALLLIGLVGPAWGAATQTGDLPEGWRLQSALRLWPDGRMERVRLPLRWQGGEAEQVQLRLNIVITGQPEGLWAMRFDRLPAEHDLRVNGERVSGNVLGREVALPRSVISRWVSVPAGLLRPGENQIDLAMDLHRAPAGLSAPLIGPSELLGPDYRRSRLLRESLPFGLNLAVSGLALFTLLVWWLRRDERLMGFFGLLMLLVSLRNLGYYTERGSFPSPVASLAFFLAQGTTVALIGGYAWASTVRGRWRGRVLPCVLAAWAAYALLGVGGMLTGRLDVLRTWLYPLVLGIAAWALWRLWSMLASLPARLRSGVKAGLVTLLIAGSHDYLYYNGWLPVDDAFWLPFLTPVLMAGVALLLLRRFVQAMDLAERHGVELERRVAERTRDLQAANAAKTRFLAAASHDLRQPVSSIGLLAGLLREHESADSAQRGLLDRLSASTVALERLLKGLLDLSRFDAGQIELRPRAVPLGPLFSAVASHEGAPAAAKGLSLRLRDAGLVVHADPVLLEQVVRNLVSNAVRYTDRGGVLLAARRQQGGVLLQVWDTGCGIPPERQSQVFEEFVQLDNPSRDSARGLGLGLSLVRRAAGLMGSEVHLRSVPGRGSCFGLWLPETQARQPRPRPARATAQGLQGRLVVVVDDDTGVRETLRTRIERWGARVQAFESVAAVQRGIDQGGLGDPIDLLVSDQRLPDGDSRDVARLLQVGRPPLAVLVITGDTAPGDLARLEALGWPVLHKPFDSDALFEAMIGALRQGR